MTGELRVPQLGESLVEATVGQWLKQEGEAVAVGEAVVRLETDKVDLEVGAEQAGVLARIEKKQGEDVKVGDLLGTIEVGGAAQQPPAPPAETAAPEKAAPPAAAPAEPVAEKGEQQPEPAAEKEEAQELEPAGPVEAGAAPPAQAAPGEDGDRASPVARRVAEDQGVDLSKVSGTGPGGKIMKGDVESFVQRGEPAAEAQAPAPAEGQAAAPPAPPRAPGEPPTPQEPAQPAAPVQPPAAAVPVAPPPEPLREERKRMTRRRQTIARRLVEAQQTAAMLTTFNEIDMSAVMEIRARRKESFKEQHGVGLGFMSFFVKASIGALKAFPMVNAEIQGDEFVLKRYYDIGIAIGAAEGLVVPVLRNADAMTFAEIEKGIKEFAAKSEGGTLTIADLQGGTFTITNGGVFGSLLSTPILNPPQSGILGLHKIEERPIASGGQVVIRPMMYVALSYDHRIIDGREAVQFLVRVKQLIEDPETLLLEG